MWLSEVWRRGFLDWIYCLTLLQPTRVQKYSNIPQRWAKVLRLFRWNTENPILLLQKNTSGGFLSTSVWMGSGSFPRHKISATCSFWDNSSLNVSETCFSTRLLNDSIHVHPQTINASEALSTEDWRSSSLSSASPGATILPSHINRMSHTPGLYCSASHSNTSQDQTSQDFSWFSWWVKIFTAFMKLTITILL